MWPFSARRPSPVPAEPLAGASPGVTVLDFAAPPATLIERRPARPAATRLVRLASGERLTPLAGATERALLVLEGGLRGDGITLERGDLFVTSEERAVALECEADSAVALVHEGSPAEPLAAPIRVGREELAGGTFAGISGLRKVYRTGLSCGLRFGPPPGARWALVGLRGVAVFSGKLLFVDGESMKEVLAGQLAVVAETRVPLHLQAGNDSALAIGFASPEVAVRLA